MIAYIVFATFYLFDQRVEYMIICYIISILMLFLKETPIVPAFSGTGQISLRNEEGNPVYLRFYKLSKSGTQMQRMYNPAGHYSIEALGFEFEQLRSGFQESQPVSGDISDSQDLPINNHGFSEP